MISKVLSAMGGKILSKSKRHILLLLFTSEASPGVPAPPGGLGQVQADRDLHGHKMDDLHRGGGEDQEPPNSENSKVFHLHYLTGSFPLPSEVSIYSSPRCDHKAEMERMLMGMEMYF